MAADILINIDVDDLGRAAAFYTAALGLKVGRRFGTFAVELTGGTSPVHLDFVVPDLEAALKAALAAGASLEREPATHKWGKIALLADPFGHGLCLIEFIGRGYDEIATG
jgi:predicted enzyme related to lactoylglutathione lyase